MRSGTAYPNTGRPGGPLRAAKTAAAAVAAGALALLLFCWVCAWTLPPLAPLPGVGNFPAVVAPLEALPADRPARIAFAGDVNNLRAYNLAQFLRAAADEGPDVIVLGGDLVHGEASDLRMRLALDEIRRAGVDVPIVTVTGNHDVNPREETFVAAFGARDFRFRVRGVMVALVDSHVASPAVPGGRDVVAFVHEPVFTRDGTRTRWGAPVAWPDDPPALLLCGHEPAYEEIRAGGTTQVQAGGDDRYLVVIEATPEGARFETRTLAPQNPPGRRLVHFGVRAADDIVRGRPKALLWLVPFLAAAVLTAAARTTGRSRTGPSPSPPGSPE